MSRYYYSFSSNFSVREVREKVWQGEVKPLSARILVFVMDHDLEKRYTVRELTDIIVASEQGVRRAVEELRYLGLFDIHNEREA